MSNATSAAPFAPIPEGYIDASPMVGVFEEILKVHASELDSALAACLRKRSQWPSPEFGQRLQSGTLGFDELALALKQGGDVRINPELAHRFMEAMYMGTELNLPSDTPFHNLRLTHVLIVMKMVTEIAIPRPLAH